MIDMEGTGSMLPLLPRPPNLNAVEQCGQDEEGRHPGQQFASPSTRFWPNTKKAPSKIDAVSINETSYKWNQTPGMPKTLKLGVPQTRLCKSPLWLSHGERRNITT